MANHTAAKPNSPAKPSALPTGNTAQGAAASASPAQVAAAKALAAANHAATATANVPPTQPTAKQPGVRTLPGNVLAALVARGATVAFVAACPKRVGSKAAAAWPTMARATTVQAAAQGPLGAADICYSLAHGQAQATVPGIGPLGAPLGTPLGVAALAAMRAALGLP